MRKREDDGQRCELLYHRYFAVPLSPANVQTPAALLLEVSGVNKKVASMPHPMHQGCAARRARLGGFTAYWLLEDFDGHFDALYTSLAVLFDIRSIYNPRVDV